MKTIIIYRAPDNYVYFKKCPSAPCGRWALINGRSKKIMLLVKLIYWKLIDLGREIWEGWVLPGVPCLVWGYYIMFSRETYVCV